ncbi:receptor-like protein 12-like [Hibiscus syriacus]|uniref:Receptor-like protein 12-like n=1 Tax=Hibiscus syriacus TaxID=106335 RepID=A0A6A3BXN4_HIBSY|nr:receptor-like protein 12-like [Hibiscus syriacus]
MILDERNHRQDPVRSIPILPNEPLFPPILPLLRFLKIWRRPWPCWGKLSFDGFTPATAKSESEEKRSDSNESAFVGLGHGRGRGTPLSSESKLPLSLLIFPNTRPVEAEDEIEVDSPAKPATDSVQSMEPTLPSSMPLVASLSGAATAATASIAADEQGRSSKESKEILSRRSEGYKEDMGLSGGRGRGRGDDANGEKLAQTIGAENMAKLVEGFEELSSRVMPSGRCLHGSDAYQLYAKMGIGLIEFEPEYLMADFETNPDIDEKPPVSLRDALKKEAIKEKMENVPLLQEIIDHYSGPDRVTAKKQQEELERVAKTLPKSAPASVKNFANRGSLSSDLTHMRQHVCHGYPGTSRRLMGLTGTVFMVELLLLEQKSH